MFCPTSKRRQDAGSGNVVQKGDAVIDATCGNGYDTLAMLKMVADRSQKGRVYALDLQDVALQNTRSLLDESLDDNEKELAELFATCHSKMEEVLPRNITVRLVAFNLGYLPGGDKTMITKSETTLLGLEAAERVVAPGGLISLLVYVGHPGGREEFETVQAFASRLPECLFVLVCDDFEEVSEAAQVFLGDQFLSRGKHDIKHDVAQIFSRLMKKLPNVVLGSEEALAISHAQKLLALIYFSGPRLVKDHLLQSPVCAPSFFFFLLGIVPYL
ncbi:putative rRNA methylase YtqB [Heracleum sosnowskyi]|uniref:rRNA methylase YtqB n=1 Tax=Heracleum sosnowskyi TaxID=360622 RepID=A0AAD8IH41_9APIA|nr:putative rRNA methylase YtqB [Heracleum sosnowskyi]